MVFLVLLINCLLGSEKIKYSDLQLFKVFFDRLRIIQNKLLQAPHMPFFLLGVVFITFCFGYFYYQSPLYTTFLGYINSGYDEIGWTFYDILKFITLVLCFIDLEFYYYLKKVVDQLSKDDIESAIIVMSKNTGVLMKSKQDVYNELIIWITHNTLYKITLPLFYYLIGDLPLLLGYYLLYLRHKDLFRVWEYVVFIPIKFISAIGGMLSLVSGSAPSVIIQSWRAIRCYAKNNKLLQNTNCNYLAIVFMFSSSTSLVFYNFKENQSIELPINKKKMPNSVEDNNSFLKSLLLDRNYFLPILVCIVNFVFYIFFRGIS